LQVIRARCVTDANSEHLSLPYITTARKENKDGIKEEMANYSILCFLFCVSDENGIDTGIVCPSPFFTSEKYVKNV
jgi:hypothetical protein